MSAVFAQQAALLSRRVTTHAERCSSAPSDGASRLRSVGVELDESVVMMANVALVVVLITLVLRERHRAPRAALPSLCPQRRPLTRPPDAVRSLGSGGGGGGAVDHALLVGLPDGGKTTIFHQVRPRPATAMRSRSRSRRTSAARTRGFGDGTGMYPTVGIRGCPTVVDT